ncbi:MAG TPA: hypothetical protein VIK55_11185 [Paludibacter sp.]
MQEIRCIYALLLIGTLFTSCEKSNLNYQNSFDSSYQEWLSFKQTSGNSYHYVVPGGSVFGPASQTDITVTNGKVTQRHFKYTTLTGLENIPVEALEWTENENEINSHPNFGAEALTLVQIYEKARTEWLIKRKDVSVYFEANNNGMISSCGYVPDGCMDDCFRGITISSVGLL